jgi:hypothetical protein
MPSIDEGESLFKRKELKTIVTIKAGTHISVVETNNTSAPGKERRNGHTRRGD